MHETMNPYADPSDFDPPTPEPTGAGRKGRIGRLPKAALTGGVIVGLALGGTGVGFAFASGSPTSASAKSAAAPTTTVPGKNAHSGPRSFGPGARFGRGGGPGLLGPGFAGGGVVHGQFTVRDGSGYKTEDIQTGTVSKVSTTSITVTSTDGFSQTYAVVANTIVDAKSGGISSVSAKDEISITGTEDGQTLTATNITDTTVLKNSRTSFGFAPLGPPGGAGPGAPNPGSGTKVGTAA